MGTYDINLEYEGRNSNFVMGMYVDTSLKDDLDMIGWNLCGCDDARFQAQIGACRIVSEQVKRGKAAIVVSLDGNDEALKEKTIEEYLDCLSDFVRHEKMGLQSRTGGKYDFTITESNFDSVELV